MENLLSDSFISKGIGSISWLEQTLWAFLAGKAYSVNYFNHAQIVMARKKLKLNQDTIAIHLVSTYRYHYKNIKCLKYNDEKVRDITLKLNNVLNHLNSLDYASQRIKKSFYRKIGMEL